VTLPGAVTALAAGEINRRDGLADLVVGVDGPDGSAVLVFEGPNGALRAAPEVVAVPTVPTALLLARLTDGPWNDLAVAAGDELWIVRGRDRRLVLGEDQRGEVHTPSVERIEMPAAIEALAWGDFAWEPTQSREFALLLKDGSIRLLSREAPADGSDAAPSSVASWTTIGWRHLPSPAGNASAPLSSRALLMPLRLSGSPTEDLAIFDGSVGRSQLLGGMVREESGAASLADPGTVAALELEQAPVAATAMRLNADALSDLVLLLPDRGVPLMLPSVQQGTISVDTAADDATGGDGDCTLREAIHNANANADTTGGDCAAGTGVDSIAFNIGGLGSPATIPLGTALPVVSDPVMIDGMTQGCLRPPCIVLDGSGAGAVNGGVDLAAGTSSIRGLAIHSFDGPGIRIGSSGNIVEGNHLGTDRTGTFALGNADNGVRMFVSSNTIGGTSQSARNLISGNG